MTDTDRERRRRLTHRALPLLGGVAAVALVAGVVIGSQAEGGAVSTAKGFARAWEVEDYSAMHDLLTPAAQDRYSVATLRRAYEGSALTATSVGVRAVVDGSDGDKARVRVALTTRVFGTVRGEVALPVQDHHVDWDPSLVFPGLRQDETLTRRIRVPHRGKVISRDGKTIVAGPAGARRSPLGAGGDAIAGRLEAPKAARARGALEARGFPRGTQVGVTGLERTFESQLAGRPGGVLLAGRRVLARRPARAAAPVPTTIDSRLQRAAVTALGARFGGVAALDPRTGEVRALAGVAYSAPQPPGSTFKLVTTTAALEAGLVKLTDKFPVETKAVIDGVDLENANGESCGGTFRQSFARSCNSVFAPLGAKVGAKRLVAAAKLYGFNEPAGLSGEAPSTLPAAKEITSPLAVGSTAIGQGKVLATPLRMANIAQTVASRGVRLEPTLMPVRKRPPGAPGGGERGVRVTSRRVALKIEQLMVDVVKYGTGTSAALPKFQVAGKTGTAELADTRGPNAERAQVAPEGNVGSNTDAWFTSYAPVGRPRLAVAVLLIRSGAGGETAAPLAKAVLQAGLGGG